MEYENKILAGTIQEIKNDRTDKEEVVEKETVKEKPVVEPKVDKVTLWGTALTLLKGVFRVAPAF